MGETILNRLGIADEVAVPEVDAPAPDNPEAGITEEPPAKDADPDNPEDKEPKVPIIGMDGKTEDGSMPYEILKDRLEWLK